MSNDISTMYTKERNQKDGRKGFYSWKEKKDDCIAPAAYGGYILRHGKRGKRNGSTR